jgi:integrase
MGRSAGEHTIVLKDGLHIYLRGKTWWVYAKIQGQDGPLRKSLHTSQRSLAEGQAWTEFDEANVRVRMGKPAGRVSFAKLAEDYLVSIANNSSMTYHKETIQRHLAPFFAIHVPDFSELNDSDILDYIQWRLKKTSRGSVPKNQTLNRENIVLRGLVAHAVRRGYISKDKAPEIAALKSDTKRRPAFSRDELAELIELAAKRIGLITHAGHQERRRLLLDWIVIMANAGMRPDEARQLTWGEVFMDDDPPYLHIPQSKSKRRKPRNTYPMPAAIDQLRTLKARQTDYLAQYRRKLKNSDFVFASHVHAKEEAIVGSFKGALRTLLEACSFSRSKADGELSSESLRHTYATIRECSC